MKQSSNRSLDFYIQLQQSSHSDHSFFALSLSLAGLKSGRGRRHQGAWPGITACIIKGLRRRRRAWRRGWSRRRLRIAGSGWRRGRRPTCELMYDCHDDDECAEEDVGLGLRDVVLSNRCFTISWSARMMRNWKESSAMMSDDIIVMMWRLSEQSLIK